MANLITGLFDTESAAENAVSQLHMVGYDQNEVSIIMKDRAAASDFAEVTGSRSMEGVGTGAAIGGTIGAVLAGLLAIGSIAIPPVGLVASGSLAAMLAGAGAGGLAGSLIGWLVGAGIPEDVAPYYEHGLNEGGIVVVVAAHSGDETRVQQILHGGAVAYAGASAPSYVSPTYASRYNDLNRLERTDSMNNTKLTNPPNYSSDETNAYLTGTKTNVQAERDINEIGAEHRLENNAAMEHERNARNDTDRTESTSTTVTTAEREVDATEADMAQRDSRPVNP